MTLELDARQRAMLVEMGVNVWLPGTAFDPLGLQSPAAAAAPGAQVPQTVPVPVPAPPRSSPAAKPDFPGKATAFTTAPTAQAGAQELGDAAALQVAAAQCSACGLCAGRSQTTLQAQAVRQCDWMVVGDAPDEEEDRAGHPFAQAPGVLLDNMLRAVGVARDASGPRGAYVTNIVKCRPPHGQVPQPADLAQCDRFLQREMALVQPKIILAMGRFAIQGLLAHTPDLAGQPLGRLRGTVHQYAGVPVVVTYAPKMLLRASADKAKAWVDLCLALDTLGQP